MLKALMGGGKGIRLVRDENEVREAFLNAKSEALSLYICVRLKCMKKYELTGETEPLNFDLIHKSIAILRNFLNINIMNRFIQTKFFFLLKVNKNIQLSSLEGKYVEFASFLFAESVTAGKMAYLNALVYTWTELASLAEMPEKKVCCRF
jgi:hypothetical protein